MKKILPLLGFGAVAFGIVTWLRKKAEAGENLKYEPVDVAIDLTRTKSSLYTKVFYNVRLRLVNDAPVSVNVKQVNLDVYYGDTKLGNIINNTPFSVGGKSQKEIKLETSISTLSAISIIKDIILTGLNDPLIVQGFINTDLGKVDVKFTKETSGGISAPARFKKSYDVIYKTTSNKMMVAHNVQSKTKKGAQKIIENQMKNSSSFDKVILVNEV